MPQVLQILVWKYPFQSTGQLVQTPDLNHGPGTEVFSRNTSWIVYIFFLRDEMKFTVSWTDWLDGGFFNLTQ